ncbi:MAG: glycosyltransferase, partial [Actinobacteria bacterium]|nr:glycosyltransferase [Actinomycetota bacterium]
MTLPDPTQATVYARKGVEALLRAGWVAPEFLAARRLRSQMPPTSDGDHVLMLSPRDWVEHVQNQAMLAHALQLRGARVTFATCGGGLSICDRANTYEAPPMPCRSCRHYTRGAIAAHGFPELRLSDFGDWSDPDPWDELDSISRGDLRDVEWHDLPLGRLVDIPVKWFLCAANVGDDPLVGHVQRAFLRSARTIAASVEDLLDTAEPDVVLLMSGLFVFEAVTWEICRRRGIDVVSHERAFRRNTIVYSRDRPAGHYDFDAQWSRRSDHLTPAQDAELDEYLMSRRNGEALDQFWGFMPGDGDLGDGGNADVQDRSVGRLVVLFTNVTWDSAVVDRDLAFPSIREWLDAAVDEFRLRGADHLVIRVHPSETHLPGKATRDSLATYLERVELPPNVRVIGPDDPFDSYVLMDAADVGLVYTSTAGLELAVGGTPVIVAGDTHYRGKGFTTDIDSRQAFTAALDDVLSNPEAHAPDVMLARRYAHLFFFGAP